MVLGLSIVSVNLISVELNSITHRGNIKEDARAVLLSNLAPPPPSYIELKWPLS